MNVGDIKIRVKRQFGDESNVQVLDTDIMRWINDACLDFATKNELLETKATSASILGIAEYTLPIDIRSLRSIRYNGIKLRGMSLQQADEYINSYEDVSNYPQGIPEAFWIWANKFVVYPTPDIAGATSFTVYYHRLPVDVITDSQIPDIPKIYHPRIVEYCLQQAYELDENLEAMTIKGNQVASGLLREQEDLTFTDRTYYPTITVLDEDA